MLRKLEESHSEEISNFYIDIKNTFGITYTPDFFKILANNFTVALGVWEGYKNILASGCLPLQIKEMIFLYVALERKCNYCSSTHLAVCNMVDVNHDNINGLKNDLDLIKPTEIRIVLYFVRDFIKGNSTVLSLKELNRIGFSEEEVVEIISMITLCNTAVNIALTLEISDIEPEINEYLTECNLQTGL